MNMKTLLGTAAGLMVATGAYAADLPGEAAPAAVDYVKVCDAYGAGFFYIPGTETCLDISGRVRARVVYESEGDADLVRFKTDGRIQFDARTASDLGTVRSFFETDLGGTDGGDITLGDAFIQVGYLTVGKFGDIANGGSFYGDADVIWSLFDRGGSGAQILVDNLGGGFYVGAGIHGAEANSVIWETGSQAEYTAAAAVGINGQSWGSFDLSAVYVAVDGNDADTWGVKATADLKLIDKLTARLSAAYEDGGFPGDDSMAGIAGALKYQATDALAVYAGVGATFWDDADEVVTAQIGADYSFTPDLILTAEGNYTTDGGINTPADDSWSAMLKLTRNW
ncbi:Porin subfamily protein [Pleomorphomonas diazotrophica]|nr:porin [Pleomorphomonas diazotrophica]SFM79528.1 Porin subfamily protein [Pleomorphomonas diazotrophica]